MSRMSSKYRGVVSQENASHSCCAVHTCAPQVFMTAATWQSETRSNPRPFHHLTSYDDWHG